MAVLVDYRCPACGGRSERWVATPPPERQCCAACGSEARRCWSSVGFVRSGAPAPDLAALSLPSRTPLCVTNPDVPGLCHMSEDAGRAWVARARSDNRALDRELARQEAAAALAVPTMHHAVSHTHGHGDHTH